MKEYRKIRKVAILGSGVMGSQIAAHCVNAGLEVFLLDLKSDETKRPNKIAEESVKKISKIKPAPFALPEFAQLINVGNFEDDLASLSNVDWICEVVIKRMDIKQELLAKIDIRFKEYQNSLWELQRAGMPGLPQGMYPGSGELSRLEGEM